MLSKTAILVFSRLPQQEVSCKNIAENTKYSFDVWKHLYNQTIATATQTKLPIILCGEDVQEGKNFAEKITNSIISAFSSDIENLIIIGTDIPNLSSAHLNFVKSELVHGREIVAGKDMRGGIYLLGLNKSSFNASTFLKFSWQTNRLFHEICEYSSQFNFSILSAVLSDLNTKADAQRCLSFFNTKQALRVLLFTIFRRIQEFGHNRNTLRINQLSILPNILRGPPPGL